MPKVLFDSTVYIDLERANKQKNQSWARSTLRNAIRYRSNFGKPFLSTITVTEILRGLHRDIDPRKAQLFRQEVLNDFEVIDFDLPVSFLAGEMIAKLEASGANIGVSDCLIAATAVQSGLSLVTANTRHFSRLVVLGYPLNLENWREAQA